MCTVVVCYDLLRFLPSDGSDGPIERHRHYPAPLEQHRQLRAQLVFSPNLLVYHHFPHHIGYESGYPYVMTDPGSSLVRFCSFGFQVQLFSMFQLLMGAYWYWWTLLLVIVWFLHVVPFPGSTCVWCSLSLINYPAFKKSYFNTFRLYTPCLQMHTSCYLQQWCWLDHPEVSLVELTTR